MGSVQEAGSGSGKAIQLPIVDITRFDRDVGKQLLDAATKYGFLYLSPRGTGFTESMVDREFALSRQFFALPESQKDGCKMDHSNRGWTGMHDEILDPKSQRKGDFKEAFNMGEFAGGRPQQPFPALLEDHLEELAEFERTCQQTCARVLDLLALGLEVDEPNFFSARHTQPSGCSVRLLHYPAVPADVDYDPVVDVRAGAHSDYGSITLLFQRPSQPGLEIRTPDDTWAPVPVFPEGYDASATLPPILVNIGDLLSYWTNGLLKSTVHRVIFPKEARRGAEDRYSIAYFCHPADAMELVAIPSRLVASHALEEGVEVGYGGGVSGKRALTAREHLMTRLDATYGFRGAKTNTAGVGAA